MDRLITLKEFEAEWRNLFRHNNNNKRFSLEDAVGPFDGTVSANANAPAAHASRRDATAARTTAKDPFDCSALEIPPLHRLVEQEAEKFVREWRELDGRKVIMASAPVDTDRNRAATTGTAAAAPKDLGTSPKEEQESHQEFPPAPQLVKARNKRKVKESGLPSWYDHPNRVRLPLRFDYLCRHSSARDAVAAAVAAVERSTAASFSSPPHQSATRNLEEDEEDRAALEREDNLRVLSLTDPSLTTSYHEELWRLFSRIPAASELESAVIGGATADESSSSSSSSSLFLPRMHRLGTSSLVDPQLRGTTMKAPSSAVKQDSRILLLERLRLSERHAVPPFSLSELMAGLVAARDDDTSAMMTNTIDGNEASTIRFECWRRTSALPPTTSPSVFPDPHRMSVEFLGSQTLLDFHRVLVEMAGDTLWTHPRHCWNRPDAEETTTVLPKEREPHPSSGYFFIEDTFYTTSDSRADYVTPIRNWLSSLIPDQPGDEGMLGSEKGQRLARLGLSVEAVRGGLKVATMSETRLEDVALRLGVRYVHVHHGSVECSVFCVDRRLVAIDSGPSRYPLLHDVWTLPYPTPACDGCQHRTPVFVTAPACAMTDGGPRSLCHSCAQQLQVPPSELELHSTYMAN